MVQTPTNMSVCCIVPYVKWTMQSHYNLFTARLHACEKGGGISRTRVRGLPAPVWLHFSLDVTEAKNKVKANRAASQQRLREFTFNIDTGAVSQRVVSNVFGDFPSIPRHLAGQSISCLHCICL